jgi:voltage-gated potassium channel
MQYFTRHLLDLAIVTLPPLRPLRLLRLLILLKVLNPAEPPIRYAGASPPTSSAPPPCCCSVPLAVLDAERRHEANVTTFGDAIGKGGIGGVE